MEGKETFEANFFRSGPQFIILIGGTLFSIALVIISFFAFGLQSQSADVILIIGSVLAGVATTIYFFYRHSVVPCTVAAGDLKLSLKFTRKSIFYSGEPMEIAWREMTDLTLHQNPESRRYYVKVKANLPWKTFFLSLKGAASLDGDSLLWKTLKEKYQVRQD